MLRALCCDFDGTLAHFRGDFDAHLDGLRLELGLIACDFATFREKLVLELGRDGPVSLHSALRRVHDEFGLIPPDDLRAICERAVADYARNVELAEGADRLLSAAESIDLPVAVISNGPVDMQLAALEATGVATRVAAAIISGAGDVACRKPAAQIFRLALHALGANPGESLMVGDDLVNDVLGARAAGLQVVHLNASGADPSTTGTDAGAVPSIAGLDELTERLLR